MQRLLILAACAAVCSAFTLKQHSAKGTILETRGHHPIGEPGPAVELAAAPQSEAPEESKAPEASSLSEDPSESAERVPTESEAPKDLDGSAQQTDPPENAEAAPDSEASAESRLGSEGEVAQPHTPTERSALAERLNSSMPEVPQQPGCYVWMPSGCSAASQRFRADLQGFSRGLEISAWKRDVFGEAHEKAGVSREACEVNRKNQYNNWCGTTDAKMLFVPGQGPPPPAVPGCYVWMPTGCPKMQFHAMTSWRHTSYDNEIGCATDGKKKYDTWCGREDAKTLWVPRAPKAPKEPGCYLWMPTGCPKHPLHVRQQWKRDVWGEENARAAADRTVCESQRRGHLNAWCGTSDAKMLYVDGAPPARSASD